MSANDEKGTISKRDVYVEVESNDPKSMPFGPKDKQLEELATRIADALTGKKSVSKPFITQAQKASWALDQLIAVNPKLTPDSLKKVLWWMGHHKLPNRDARDELFRIAKRGDQLAAYLLAMGVPADQLVLEWDFDVSDAAALVAGVLVGAANGLGAVGRDMIVFAAIGGVLAVAFGPLVGAAVAVVLPFVVSLGPMELGPSDAPPNATAFFGKVSLRDPGAVIREVLGFVLSESKRVQAWASLSAHVTTLIAQRRYYAGGKEIGDAMVQVVLLRLAAKQLQSLASQLSPKLPAPPGYLLSKFREAKFQDRLKGANHTESIDGWELYRTRDGHIIARSSGEAYRMAAADVAQRSPAAASVRTQPAPQRQKMPPNGFQERSRGTEDFKRGTDGRAIERPSTNATEKVGDPLLFAAPKSKRSFRSKAPTPRRPPRFGSSKWSRLPLTRAGEQPAVTRPARYRRNGVDVNSWSDEFYFGTKRSRWRAELEALLLANKNSPLSEFLLRNGKLRSDVHAGHMWSDSPHYDDFIAVQAGEENMRYGLDLESGDGGASRMAKDRVLVLDDGHLQIAFDQGSAWKFVGEGLSKALVEAARVVDLFE